MIACLRTIAIVLGGVHVAAAAIVVGPWESIYQGVDYATGSADALEPAHQSVNALRVDLLEPGISFLTTPSNGGAQEETNAQTASDFLTMHGAQVAINANFFNPGPLFQSNGQPKDLEGLAISQGNLVSPQVNDPTVNRWQVLLIEQDNSARFDNTRSNPIDLTGVHNAVTGDQRLLLNGIVVAPIGGERHPRTAVGISQDNRYLTMLTVDGRQDGFSEGATFFELSQWMFRFGAYSAIALDGGGSTTMVRSDDQGGAVLLNRPIGAGLFGNNPGERYNGNHLGVFAAALPPEPGDFDSDGDVDNDDLMKWQGGFGTLNGAQLIEGDANADGDVDGADFLVWQRNYQSADNLAIALPEPTAFMILLVGLATITWGRRVRGQAKSIRFIAAEAHSGHHQ